MPVTGCGALVCFYCLKKKKKGVSEDLVYTSISSLLLGSILNNECPHF